MSKRENNGEIYEKSKQKKPNENDPNAIVAAVIPVIPNQKPPPAIFKLNAICCDDLFEWLSLKDLHSLGQTCKRMHRLTGVYFKENFKEMLICKDENIHYNRFKLNGFSPFVESIKLLSESNVANYQFIGANCNSLRHLYFGRVSLWEKRIAYIEANLNKIETIRFDDYNFSSINLYDNFLRFCPNLKSLHVRYSTGNGWMDHSYPKLEHLAVFHAGLAGPYFERFFKKNAHLQSFEIDYWNLLVKREKIINSNLRLNVLTIYGGDKTTDQLKNVCALLNTLHQNGFYKRLEYGLISHSLYALEINEISKLPGLVKLFGHFQRNFVFPKIVGLRNCLCIVNDDMNNLDTITDSFPNLRQVSLCAMSMYQLLPFIQRLPALNELVFSHFTDSFIYEFGFDLQALHSEREKLAGACKVIVYLEENEYLATKWATKNLYTDHSLIEIRRIEKKGFDNHLRYGTLRPKIL